MRNAPIVPALTIALLFSIGACEPDNVTDVATDPAAPFDLETSDGAVEIARVEEEKLTSEQIAEVRRRVVASLPVDDLGRIDIVDAGIDGTPWYVYVSVGGDGVHDVLDQLDEQDATPAEVFLALAPREVALPHVLVRDHDKRAARGDASSDGPRRLPFTIRELGLVRRDCATTNDVDPQSFASWTDEFRSWSNGYVDWDTHSEEVVKAEGTTSYLFSAETSRAMSVCDASHTGNSSNNVVVKFSGLSYTDPHGPFHLFYIADNLTDFDSARMKSSEGPYYKYYILISQNHPPPRRAYVAFGNCNHGTFCFSGK